MKAKKLTIGSWILTAIILLIGFLLMQYELVDYGYTFFILFPLFLGFSIGLLFKKGIHVLYMAIGIIAGCLALIMFRIEGFVCVLMLLPIFLLFVTIGYFIGRKIRINTTNQSTKIMVSILPLVVLYLLGSIELKSNLESKIIEIETSALLIVKR